MFLHRVLHFSASLASFAFLTDVALTDEAGEVVHGDEHVHLAIEAVEDAAVTGNERTAVFHPRLAL